MWLNAKDHDQPTFDQLFTVKSQISDTLNEVCRDVRQKYVDDEGDPIFCFSMSSFYACAILISLKSVECTYGYILCSDFFMDDG